MCESLKLTERKAQRETVQILLSGEISEYHGKCGYVFHMANGKCSEPCPFPDCKFKEVSN